MNNKRGDNKVGYQTLIKTHYMIQTALLHIKNVIKNKRVFRNEQQKNTRLCMIAHREFMFLGKKIIIWTRIHVACTDEFQISRQVSGGTQYKIICVFNIYYLQGINISLYIHCCDRKMNLIIDDMFLFLKMF